MVGNYKISLVLPCKNEENALPRVLSHVPGLVDEVLVVDNGSDDSTYNVASKLATRVLSEPRTKNGIGYGFALAQGIRNATGDIIICMDADGSYPTDYIPQLITVLLKENLDFISCNRLPFQHKKRMSWVRMLGVKMLNIWMQVLYNVSIQDCLTGMWVFNAKARAMLTLFEGDWNFSLEIKLNAITNREIRFAEYHIPYHDREFDSSKQNLFLTGVKHAFFLLKMRLFFSRARNTTKAILYSPLQEAQM